MTTKENKETKETTTGKQGFASMDKDEQREIASKGGKAAHEKGTAHEFSHDEAVEAGKKGGSASSTVSNSSSSSSSKNQEDENKGTHARGSHASSKAKNDDSEDDESEATPKKSGKQGFASMDKEHQKEVASKGGKK